MAFNKHSNLRLVRLVAMLRENRYPNHVRLMEEMRAGGYPDFKVNQKTFTRDMATLREDYGAPLAFDESKKGYYLTDAKWRFDATALRNNEQEAVLVSARLAEGILPKKIGTRLRQTAEAVVPSVIPDEREALMSLVTLCSRAPVQPSIFQEVFQGWRKHNVLLVRYISAAHQRETEMLLEPHVLAFYEGNWYLKAKILRRDNLSFEETKDANVLTLALHRFQSVACTETDFVPDSQLISTVNEGNIFDLPLVHRVRLRLTGKSRIYGKELFSYSKLEDIDSETIELTIPAIEEYRIVNFVLCSDGEAQVIAPKRLKLLIEDKIDKLS